MNKFIYLLSLATAFASCAGDSLTSQEQKIEALLAQMTLEEKLGQMNIVSDPYMSTGTSEESGDIKNREEFDALVRSGKVGNFLNVLGAENTGRLQKIAVEESRLGIPLLFGYDVIHGYKTIFPIPLADAASFDLEAVELSSKYAAMEAAVNGINWTFAPMIDISRDPRWGRVMEGAGEDVFLTTQVALARTKGFQGDSLNDPNSIAACAKHFVGYGASMAGRDYASVDISPRMLEEVYLPPFRAVADAGIATFMSSFNTVNGEPVSTSKWLLTDVLKDDWGYDGFVVSDWASVYETVAHGTAADGKQSACNGINAGVDMDMASNVFIQNGEDLVNKGQVDEAKLDDAVRRILKTKFDLGLFDDPYKYSNAQREEDLTMTQESFDAARDVARKSIVLMKNDNQVLPLSKDIKTIAVIGALAEDKDSPLGNWRGNVTPNTAVNLLEGIQQAVGDNVEVIYAKGCDIVNNKEMKFFTQLEENHTDRSGFTQAVEAAKKADVVIMAVGEVAYMSGECRSYGDISLKGLQSELIEEVAKVGKPMVMTLFTGRPLVLTDVVDEPDAILNCWLLGSASGNAIADVIFGDYNPSGKLPMTFPYHLGQVPIYYSQMNGGRPWDDNEGGFSSKYRDIPNTPLFAFGHGLSYTDFEYSGLTLSDSIMSGQQPMTVTVNVTNTGKYDGSEVVQLYVRDLVGNGISRPLLELKGFEKVFIPKGQSRDVSFTLTSDDLAFYRLDKTFAPEAGDFSLFVGGASDNLPLQADFALEEN